jgi:hypothetical protein
MRTARLQKLEEMVAKLLATAQSLPPGQDHHNALREVARFRAQITDLQRQEIQSADPRAEGGRGNNGRRAIPPER